MNCNHLYSRSINQEYPRKCLHCGEPESQEFPTKSDTLSTRFELEQAIMECWQITEDIPLLEQLKANPADFTSLATVYEYKFQNLWNIFEELVKERKL